MKVLEAIKNSSYDSFGIRRTCADEDYKVGDIARNSFYWGVENDLSSYQTEPEEMDGTSPRKHRQVYCLWERVCC